MSERPERPLILFSRYEKAEKARRYGGASSFHRPTHKQQVNRLTPQFSVLQSALEQGRITIQKSSGNVEPEYTLVLEVAGNPQDFDKAVRNLQNECGGVEWLFELVDNEGTNDADFFRMDKDGSIDNSKQMTFKYFCVLTNQQALSEILSLWNHFQKDPKYKFPTGMTGFRNVFQTLKDIHLWGVSERLEETGILEAWEYDLQDPDLPMVNCEIELFYRKSEQKRKESLTQVKNIIESVGGKVITNSCISEIEYLAILASIPRQYAEIILKSRNVALVQLEQIMFFKPTGQTIVTYADENINYQNNICIPANISEEPVIALFDGLPQENHPLLSDMIIIDDPDDITSSYQVKNRVHGTSMASLILHGNLDNYEKTVIRKIYVRPIMKPYVTGNEKAQEFIPNDVLIVDKIHIAVRRLFEDEAGKVAPSIRIINLSIGLGDRLFYNMISPLAKLLDWLSYKYRVLFIVSAGNHPQPMDLGMTFNEFKALTEPEKNTKIIQLMDKDSRQLRLLSPAESMNALTVGALFKDYSSSIPNYRQVLPCSNGMLSPISSLGRGINKSIKPDILFDGGKSFLIENIIHTQLATWRNSGSNTPPGILSARPLDIQAGNIPVGYSFGTSDATALISHNASECYDILNDIFQAELNSDVPKEYVALILKAMLIHGAKWGELADIIRESLDFSGRAADEIHKWLGYGIPDIARVKECTKNRITLIGYGELQQDTAHLFYLPLPFDFHAKKMFRCLTVTLTSFTPIQPTTQKYRTSQLWFTIDDGGKKLVPNRLDASDKAVVRGTVQHERFAGDRVVVWDEDESLKIKVNCRADARDFATAIPYALLVSFEIAPELDIDVYQKITDKVHIKDAVKPKDIIKSKTI